MPFGGGEHLKILHLGRMIWLKRRERRSVLLEVRNAGFAKHCRAMHRVAGAPKLRTVVLTVPTRIAADRDEDRRPLLALLRSISAALSDGGARVKLDFCHTVHMYPGGMLLLVAHLELFADIMPGKIRARCTPGSRIAQLLGHFGLADRLGIPASSSLASHDSVVTWKYCTGSQADGKTIADLIEGYRTLTSAEIPTGLYEALTEALTNVRHHAYPVGELLPDHLRRWWLFSRYVAPTGQAEGSLFIGVYDIGAGIQTTLRHKLQGSEKLLKVGETLESLLGVPFGSANQLDRVLLKAAIEQPRSGTGFEFRGNGLPEMRAFISSTSTGKLLIVSGQSQYVHLAQSGKSTTYGCVEGIRGTLIVWSMPLTARRIT